MASNRKSAKESKETEAEPEDVKPLDAIEAPAAPEAFGPVNGSIRSLSESEIVPEPEAVPALADRAVDRQRLGTLLRRGQRLALHVQAKIALPEFTGWAQDVQHFMNEFGL